MKPPVGVVGLSRRHYWGDCPLIPPDLASLVAATRPQRPGDLHGSVQVLLQTLNYTLLVRNQTLSAHLYNCHHRRPRCHRVLMKQANERSKWDRATIARRVIFRRRRGFGVRSHAADTVITHSFCSPLKRIG